MAPESPMPMSSGDQKRSDLKRKLEEMKLLIDQQRQMQSEILTLDVDKEEDVIERRAPVHAGKYPSYQAIDTPNMPPRLLGR